MRRSWFNATRWRPGLVLAVLALACLDVEHPSHTTPAVDAGPDIRAETGHGVTLLAAVSGASGEFDIRRYSIAWGDGDSTTGILATGATQITANHTYPADGTYPVRVTATDGDGMAGSDTLSVIVEPPGTPQVFVGAGDIGECGLGIEVKTAAILDTIPGTVFTVGDNAYPSGSPDNFASCFAPSWGRDKKRLHPTPGNHEYITPGASGYFDYFGVAAGDPKRGYYSYDLGAWHIIVLNSNIAGVNNKVPLAPQVAWLRADLAAHPGLCTLAMWHHPRFSSGTTHGSDTVYNVFWRILSDAGADVVLTAHEHNYERFAPQNAAGVLDSVNGIREFVVGVGGGGYDPLGPPIANSEISSINHGVVKFTLGPSSYSWEFVPVPGSPTPGQTFSDSGSAACH
jgi:hypothetical protein